MEFALYKFIIIIIIIIIIVVVVVVVVIVSFIAVLICWRLFLHQPPAGHN